MSDEHVEMVQRIGREVREHNTKLQIYEERLRQLEHDYSEMAKDFKEVQAALTKVEVLLHTLNRDVMTSINVVEKNIKLAIADHEGKEFTNQRGVTLWLASTLLAILGTIGWFIFEQVVNGRLS